MPQLDNYLVTLGMKGQNVVLAQMEKIRKGKKDLAKKVNVNLTAKGGKGGAPATTPEKLYDQEKKENEKVKKTHKEESEREKKNTSAFKDAAGKFGQGVQGFASAAASIDPIAAMSSVTTAIGTSLSGIEVLGVGLGELPKGIAQIANSTLSMARNAFEMAKQATATTYALKTRDAAAAHYGGGIGQGQLSNQERAMLIDAVSSSMGRIKPELAGEINKLIGTKDTRALARVAGGDWESTGEDRGWMLGQVMSGMGSLPPSVKQNIQASLLSRNADLIQNLTGEQGAAQENAATFANMEEERSLNMYKKAAPGGVLDPNLKGIQSKLNTMEGAIYSAGLSMAETMNEVVDTIASIPTKVKKVTEAVDDILNSAALRRITESVGLREAVNTTRPAQSPTVRR